MCHTQCHKYKTICFHSQKYIFTVISVLDCDYHFPLLITEKQKLFRKIKIGLLKYVSESADITRSTKINFAFYFPLIYWKSWYQKKIVKLFKVNYVPIPMSYKILTRCIKCYLMLVMHVLRGIELYSSFSPFFLFCSVLEGQLYSH